MKNGIAAAGYPAAILVLLLIIPFGGQAISGDAPSFEPLSGEWVRTDGGYRVQVLGIRDDGAADVRS